MMRIFNTLVLMLTLLCHGAFAATIDLPQSGQTSCYDSAGAVISCAGTGQDGDTLTGVAFNDATRFSDNGNGTITDTLTGLIWLKNANCTDTVGGIAKSGGTLTWNDALTWSNTMATGKCGLTDGSSAGQWRLPTRKELSSLVNLGQANNATWLGTKGFTAVQRGYWSSSSHANDTSAAWEVYLDVGNVGYGSKDFGFYVWPVRGGQ